jgi:hypothetical protein
MSFKGFNNKKITIFVKKKKFHFYFGKGIFGGKKFTLQRSFFPNFFQYKKLPGVSISSSGMVSEEKVFRDLYMKVQIFTKNYQLFKCIK